MTSLYGINNCDTIKKVRRWLDQQGIEYDFHDYKKDGCEPALANKILKQFGLETVINRRGTTWRKLPESVKASLNSDSAIKLMAENPSLIKRPILHHKQQWLIGFDEQQWLATIKHQEINQVASD